ncbi:hypothetical protein WMY93_029766 [Mugilogobius chulae]|uniref:ribonuclease H n=1 Tax=Mugilogobius chulae TaxID=88201 RepID=A0AAW0MKS1_9GOBI
MVAVVGYEPTPPEKLEPKSRAGKQQVNEEEIEDGHQEGATADPSTEPASHTTPSLAEIANLLRGLVKKQQEHDAKWEQDKLQQEDRWQSMERRVEQLQQEVKAEHPDLQPVLEGAAAAPVAVPVSPALGSGLVRIPSWKGPKMQPYQEDEDIEHYLTTFERIATACQWPHEEWALHLAPLLNGRARAAYVAMDITETMDYDKVKKAVLEKFEISAETYRVRFRSSVVREDESPKELQSRLKDLFDKWMTPREKTKEQIGDAIVLEQFLRMQTPDLRTWIKERNPTTSREAAELAEAFLSARRPFKSSFSTKPSAIPPPVSKLVGGNGYKNKAPRPPFTNVTGPRFKEFKHKGPVVCHSCGQPGHIKPECPVQQVSKTYMCFAPQPQCVLEEVSPPIGDEERTVCVIIDDKPHVALLDSGSSRTLIREDCLPRDVTFCGKVKVWCVHGDNVDYPVANVNIQVEGQQYLLSVGVMSKLPYQVILGWDLPVLRELLAKSNDKDNIIPVESLAVVTRSSHKQRVEPECGDGDWDLPFQDCIVPDSGCSTKGPRKSKSQKRQEKVKGTKMVESVSAPISDKLMIIPDDLVKLQHGLVERFNKTLKSMLKKFVEDSGADWDQWLPFLLFAYREVPQASTGFSPFQLLYGHVVRGPLDVLKEAWEAPNPEKPCNVLSYVLKMRDKLEQMQQLANIHLSQAQKKQKLNYDKAARRRSFREGQKVLLLLPTSECGLLAKWQGPYEVSRKVGPVTYELYMPDRRKKHQIFHINLLKEWNDRASSMQLWARAVAEEDECQELFFPSTKEEQTGPDLSHLSPDQQEELQYVMDPALFSTKPGCTDLIQHDIHLRDPNQQPIRDTTSRIPAKLIPAVKQEVEDMLAMGVIEPSKSEWCSPVVLVPKKNDPRQRFCVNFSKLNAVSAFDAYPMPRVEELIERLGNAKFLTTLDLCKGYWQVPLTETSKNLTAFRVPSGLYQFKTMPFGLHGAPATFQRLVDEVLRGADSYSAAYIDDIVVFSESWGDHIKHLNDVFNRIERAGLVMNARKCHIAKTEVEYLGYIIGGGVIRPQAMSISQTWYAIKDHGTNYCNLYNLMEGSGLTEARGYREITSDFMCTQRSSANCTVY